MNNKIKKILSLVLSLIMVLGVMPLGIFTASAATEGVLMYSVSNGSAQIIGCDAAAEGEVVIPAILGDCPVTKIALYSFSECTKITGVVIPDSVEIIGEAAFADCDALKTVSIGAGVTEIGKRAFENCMSLEKIEVSKDNSAFSSDDNGVLYNKGKTELLIYPVSNAATIYTVAENVTKIPDSAFAASGNVKTIVIGDNVTEIGANAFLGSRALETVVIGKGVTKIGNDAFEGCDKLTGITIGTENTVYCTDESGVLYNKAKSVLLKYPSGNSRTAFVVPAGVSDIEILAFSNAANLKVITFTKDVKNIASSAFYACINITDVLYEGSESEWKNVTVGSNNNAILGAKITYAGGEDHDHSYTSSVTKAATCTQTGTVTYVCQCSHSYTETIPATGHAFKDNVCENCKVKEFVFTVAGDTAKITAYNGAGGALIIPEKIEGYSVNAIGDNAFENHSEITAIAIPETVKDIGSCAFYKTGYYNISSNWENGVLYIGKFLIEASASVKGEYEVKETTAVISDYAFASRNEITKIILPKYLQVIGDSAFTGCTELKWVTTGMTEEEWKAIVIGTGNEALTNAQITFYEPPHVHAYVVTDEKAATCTSDGYVKEKCACGDEKDTVLTSLGHNFESNVCTNCKEREYDIEITSDGVIIKGCNSSLVGEVAIPDEIIGYKVIAIKSKAFDGNEKITKLQIPASVKTIESFAFTGSKIAEIEVDSENENYSSANGILYSKDKTSLVYCPTAKAEKELQIPSGTKTIAEGAFYTCAQITSVKFPVGIESIGDAAFAGCTSIKTVTFDGTYTAWKKVAIGSNNEPIKNAVMTYIDTSDAELSAALAEDLKVTNGTVLSDGAVIIIVANQDIVSILLDSKTKSGNSVDVATDENAITLVAGVYSLTFSEWHKAGNKTETTITSNGNTFTLSFIFQTENGGHKYGEGVTSAPTCNEDGYTRYTCSICGNYYDTDIVEKLGHKYGGWYIEVDETCTKNGVKLQECSVCSIDTEGHYNEGVVLAKGHSYVDTVKAATCLEGGYTSHKCSRNCGEEGEELVDAYIPALGHSYTEWKYEKEATCLEGGKRTRECTVCSAETAGHSETEILDPLGHDIKAVVTEPTVDAGGYTTFTCTRCDYYSTGDDTLPLKKVLSVSVENLVINKDQEASLILNIEKLGNPDYTVTYKVADESIIEIEDGLVMGKARGTTQVTCTVTDEYGNTVSAIATVEVKFTVLQWITWFFVDVLFGFIKNI